MRWIDRAGLLAAMLGIAGCANEAGSPDHARVYGATVWHAQAWHAGRAASPEAAARLTALSRAFAAQTEPLVTFAFGSAALDAAARAALNGQAAWLLANPDAAVRLTGHADAVGSAAGNEALGLRRAIAAARHLEAAGVPPGRIAPVASAGENDPAVLTGQRERRNRRVVSDIAWLGEAPVAARLAPRDGRRAASAFGQHASPLVLGDYGRDPLLGVTEASTHRTAE